MLFSFHTQTNICQADKNGQKHVTNAQWACRGRNAQRNLTVSRLTLHIICPVPEQHVLIMKGQMWRIQSGPQMTSQLSICSFFIYRKKEQVNSFSQTDNKMSGWWHINTFPPWYSQNASCWAPQLMQGTVLQWYKSNSLSPLTQKVEIDPFFSHEQS